MTGFDSKVDQTCMGRTCMKWGANGDLTALDLAVVMARLAQVDRDVAALQQNTPPENAIPTQTEEKTQP